MLGRYSKTNNRFSDPHAPRHRIKAFDVLNSANRRFYKGMKKQYPELLKYSNADIARCVKLFNVTIANEVHDNRNGVRLTDGLGIIVAGACRVAQDIIDKKVPNTNIDHKKSEELGVPVTHHNMHSDVYIAKIKYSNEMDKHMFQNHDMWMFDACRNLSRSVSAEFKAGNHGRYIMFNTYEHIAHLFKKPKIERDRNNDKKQAYKQQKLEEYDEFAF